MSEKIRLSNQGFGMDDLHDDFRRAAEVEATTPINPPTVTVPRQEWERMRAKAHQRDLIFASYLDDTYRRQSQPMVIMTLIGVMIEPHEWPCCEDLIDEYEKKLVEIKSNPSFGKLTPSNAVEPQPTQ